MVAIPFPRSSLPGLAPAEGQGRLVNAFVETDGDLHTWRRVPGLTPFSDVGLQGPRGFVEVDGKVYGAFADTAVIIDADGVAAAIPDALPGTQPVTFARNNKAPTPDLVCVTENGAFVVTPTSIAPLDPFPDFPQPNSVGILDGFFLHTVPDGRIFASGLNSTSVAALSTAKAEAKPDGLTRGIVSGPYFYGFGPSSFERWRNVGGTPFPLLRDGVWPVGLAGPWAIAGFQDGWNEAPVFVASDDTVRILPPDGSPPPVISTRYLERLIARLPDKTTLMASVYAVGGHAFWSLSSPSWTWEYNLSTQAWHERRSAGLDGWRARHAFKFGGRWIFGDTRSGTLQRVSEDAFTEDGDPLPAVFESGLIRQFPARAAIAAAWFDFVVGQGDARSRNPCAFDPSVKIEWSHDGGATYGNPILRSLGQQGQTRRQIRVNRLGLTTHHGLRLRVTVSDPVYVAFLGGEVEAAARLA
jgi:hypothetical protein